MFYEFPIDMKKKFLGMLVVCDGTLKPLFELPIDISCLVVCEGTWKAHFFIRDFWEKLFEFPIGYLTIIPQARVGYEMIDSQRGA